MCLASRIVSSVRPEYGYLSFQTSLALMGPVCSGSSVRTLITPGCPGGSTTAKATVWWSLEIAAATICGTGGTGEALGLGWAEPLGLGLTVGAGAGDAAGEPEAPGDAVAAGKPEAATLGE